MKKNILLSLVAVIVITVFIGLTAFKSEQSNDIIVVRVFESVNSLYKSKIMITDGTSIIKEEKLSVMRPRNQDANMMIIAKTMKDLKSQGYEIVTSSSGGSEIFRITDYVMEK